MIDAEKTAIRRSVTARQKMIAAETMAEEKFQIRVALYRTVAARAKARKAA